MDVDLEDYFCVAISDQLRANYFGKDVSTQIDQAGHIVQLKRVECHVTDLGRQLQQWKRDLLLAREGLIAAYEAEVSSQAQKIGNTTTQTHPHSLTSFIDDIRVCKITQQALARSRYSEIIGALG